MGDERRLWRHGLAIAAAVVVVAAPAAIALDRSQAPPGTLRARVVASPSPSPSVALRERLEGVLTAQSDAVRRRDESGFVAIGDPALQPVLRRRYAALVALGATGWTAVLAGEPRQFGAGRWRVDVRMGFCVVVDGCVPATVTASTSWTDTADGPRLVELVESMAKRPWESSDLRAASGPRVVVAAPPALARRLPGVLAAAERAAALADRYARWRPPPGRYVVFLAGSTEWTNWYGGQHPWVAGITVPVSPDHMEIMLNAARIDDGEVETTLAHEFAHVSTLAGVQRDYSGNWLLVEGLAEYVRAAGRPVSRYPWLGPTRRLVRSGRWGGTAALREPAPNASVDEASGRYGVAYLAVLHLAQRFGEDRMLALFAAVVRDGVPLEQAAPPALGTSWADAASGCDAFVRSATR